MADVNAFFRHLAVRLWCTAFISGLLGMVFMPALQRLFGLGWSVVPLLGSIALAYMAVGWCMNRVGTLLIAHQLKEAAIWERAGMIPEAEAVFEKVAALFDSFWLSPRQRKIDDTGVSGRVARFYICQSVVTDRLRSAVTTYLQRHSNDRTVAEAWLTHLLTRETHTPAESDAADCVGDALSDNGAIQRLLFRLYLADGRVDFSAQRCYRRVWQHNQAITGTELASLARLLLNEARIDDWSLQVYLAAYGQGQQECLEGITAAVRQLPPSAGNRKDLSDAKSIVETLSSFQQETLPRHFEHQVPAAPEPAESRPSAKEIGIGVGRRFILLIAALLRGIPVLVGVVVRVCRAGVGFWMRSPGFRKSMAMGGLGLFIIGVGVAAWRLWPASTLKTEPVSAPPAVETPAAITTDPFTIQVAAYLKQDDAIRYVSQLKQAGLDAFWNEAASANRTWYQVKISHFATRSQAQNYGDQLKAKGIIDDFYVSNYNPQK
jgi:hypothetical protein